MKDILVQERLDSTFLSIPIVTPMKVSEQIQNENSSTIFSKNQDDFLKIQEKKIRPSKIMNPPIFEQFANPKSDLILEKSQENKKNSQSFELANQTSNILTSSNVQKQMNPNPSAKPSLAMPIKPPTDGEIKNALEYSNRLILMSRQMRQKEEPAKSESVGESNKSSLYPKKITKTPISSKRTTPSHSRRSSFSKERK
ncbi:hypothetical protein M0811_13710 [Anaeramoeba ignava]|uniref:Uncharacterized protein n=1 Tax=Anaeramoeba ignava TaxID=1746090 RepID=A0A9Q0L5H6_ANAIG|nr:hypothetical protein M0811_13710 [Anaeramoeba ignava]